MALYYGVLVVREGIMLAMITCVHLAWQSTASKRLREAEGGIENGTAGTAVVLGWPLADYSSCGLAG